MSGRRYMTPDEAGRVLGITADAVRCRLRRGSLRGRRVGPTRGRWLVLSSSLKVKP